jgi:polyhydroxyalkanoate synthesis regulator phasin
MYDPYSTGLDRSEAQSIARQAADDVRYDLERKVEEVRRDSDRRIDSLREEIQSLRDEVASLREEG